MRIILLAAAFSVAILPASSQDKKPDDKKKPEAKKLPRIAINDPAKLKDDKDYAVQGMYIGNIGSEKFRADVISRGEGFYDIVFYKGGISSDGGDNTPTLKALATNSEKNAKAFQLPNSKNPLSGELANGIFKITEFDVNGVNAIGELKRVENKSATSDARPPEGAIVLFNGPDDLAKWDAKAKIVELSDGKFLGVGGRTKQKFQSFTLHVEFRLPFMPNSTGQARGNSGVYIQDRYEVQVLDSFGLPLHDNECGGIYKESAPKVNMCFPPMTWQTYDIDFTAATFVDGKKTKPAVITVKHNGVVIHDQLELKNNTPGGGINKEVPEPGALYLQDHGDPVVYRNIWIVEKK